MEPSALANRARCGSLRTLIWPLIQHLRGQDIVAVSWREEAGRLIVDRERVWAHVAGDTGLGFLGAGTDGRVLIGLPKDAPPPPQVRVILNWAAELKRLVPAK